MIEKQQEEYMKNWFSLSERAATHGFTWPSLLEDDEWCQYMSTGIQKIKKEEYNDITEATNKVKLVFQRIYEFLLESHEGFLQLKLPTELWEITRMNYGGLFSYFTRFDFIVTDGNIKLIEINSDTPTGYLALIWKLHEQKEWFTEQEHAIIEKYFLPTYFSKETFEQNNIDYVKKSVFGREGGGVHIISQGKEIAADKTPYYDQQHKIYQKYVEMPDCTIDTWDGDYRGKLLVGSHLIGGEAAGLFLRVGEKITGNLSMFIGITTE